MIVLDSNFKKKDYNPRYEEIYNKTVSKISSLITDDKIKHDMLEGNNNIAFVEADSEGVYHGLVTKYEDGKEKHELKKRKIGMGAAAVKVNLVVENKKEENLVKTIPGVVLRPNYLDGDVVHELLHAMSSKENNYYNEDGITYTKIGVKIDYYDENLDDYKMDNSLSSDALNEGLTEYLTGIVLDQNRVQYPRSMAMAKLFMDCNDKLLNAYFSLDLDELDKFYTDVEEKQSIITRKDLCDLPSLNIDDERVAKILLGGIKYNEAYGKNPNVDGIINYLNNNHVLDNGLSWSDLLANAQKEYEQKSGFGSM